jgi:hypothetical protein
MKLQSNSRPCDICIMEDAAWKERSLGEMIVYSSTFQVEAKRNIEDIVLQCRLSGF